MAKVTIPFIGQSYKMPAVQLDTQTCINWYLTYDATGKFPQALFPDPGMIVFSEKSGGNEVRGMFVLNDVLYSVIDDKFYKVDSNGELEDLTSSNQPHLETAIGQVRIIPNDNQLFITDGRNGYVYQIVASASRAAGAFFKIENATSNIGKPVFSGGGPLDDMSTSGVYTGGSARVYVVEIDGSPVGGPDTFRWSDDGAVTFNASNVPITGGIQALNDGVQITFVHTTGHTVNDRWDFQVTIDSAFYTPLIPAYQDGYGIYVKQVSNRFYISAINDFSQVNALDSAQSNEWADNLMAATSIREELWLIGRQTTEVWYDVGAEIFPFEPRTNLLIKYGCLAPYTVAVAGNNILLWLANNEEGGRVLVMVESYIPSIVSTEPINAEWQSYEKVDDAIGYVYQWDGHLFYWITFPTADRTWQYDLTTKTWTERRSTLANELPYENPVRQGRWRANNYAYWQGKHLFGDFESGKIYQLARGVYTEDGNYMFRERTTRTMQKSLHRLCLYSLQLSWQKGVGLTKEADQGHDPQVMLQISTDDGVSWGNELWRSLGKIGCHTERIKWNRLGQSDSFVFRVRTTDPTYNVLMGSVIQVEDTGT